MDYFFHTSHRDLLDPKTLLGAAVWAAVFPAAAVAFGIGVRGAAQGIRHRDGGGAFPGLHGAARRRPAQGDRSQRCYGGHGDPARRSGHAARILKRSRVPSICAPPLGGCANGEIARVSNRPPRPTCARFFVRHAWYLGGGTGRPRSLSPGQEHQVFRWINGRDPRQYGLDFGLWTRRIVALLIKRKFGVRLGVTAVGALLAKLGLTPQRPL